MWRMLIGLILVAIGVLLLLERLRIVERALVVWWPAFLIALGLFLIARGLLGRQ